MDGAVPPDPSASEMIEAKPSESPRVFGWLQSHGLAIGGSLLFVGGLAWLLNAGALPVVPPAEAWAKVPGWAVAAYLVLFLFTHFLRCARWSLLIPIGQRPPILLTLTIGLVGFAAVVLLPFRLGEAVRPGLLYSRARVPLGTSAGVVGAERIVDGLVLSLLLLSGVFMLMTFAVFVVYGLLAHAFRKSVIDSPSVQTWLRRGFAAAFAGLGAKLALSDR